MLKSLIKKIKISDVLVLLQLLFIGYYSLALIMSGVIMREAVYYRDLNLIITSNSWVPLIRMVNTLLDVQVFNRVGLIEVTTAILLLIKGLTVFDMIFIVNFLIIIYFYLFRNIESRFFNNSIYVINSFIVIALLMLIASSLAAINSLLFASANPLTVVPIFALMFIIFGVIYFTITLVFWAFYFYIRWIYHKL